MSDVYPSVLRQVRQAYDQTRAQRSSPDAVRPQAVRTNVIDLPVCREMSVTQALEWAFAREHARIDFEDDGSGSARAGVSSIWVMMQRGQLGCQIDGGGRSRSHHDADVIAAILEAMPIELGGKSMVLQIATLARAGLQPDWMKDAKPRCVPVGWRQCKHGRFAKTKIVGVDKRVFRGRTILTDILVCPVMYETPYQQIEAVRQRYLDWWGALLWLRQELSWAGMTSVKITGRMPPMTPWRKEGQADD
jgi:hypothetical protein